MRVLLIEDEPTTARAIELMLTTEGFNVYSTDLGEEGLDLGKLYDYDIILLDLNLPDMHGYDVLKKLRVAMFFSYYSIKNLHFLNLLLSKSYSLFVFVTCLILSLL